MSLTVIILSLIREAYDVISYRYKTGDNDHEKQENILNIFTAKGGEC